MAVITILKIIILGYSWDSFLLALYFSFAHLRPQRHSISSKWDFAKHANRNQANILTNGYLFSYHNKGLFLFLFLF